MRARWALGSWLAGFTDDPHFEQLMQQADPWSPSGELFPYLYGPLPVGAACNAECYSKETT